MDAPAPSAPKRVVVWRSSLISPSETFIRNQTDAMTEWHPTLVGAKLRTSSLSRPEDEVVFGDSRRERVARRGFTLLGRSQRVRETLSRSHPALVHAHFVDTAWTVSKEVENLGVPLVTTAHGYDVTKYPAQDGLRGIRARRHTRLVLERSALILAVSVYIRERLIENGADPKKTIVHHIGIPIPQLPDRREVKWDIAFVGRFVEKKGVLDLLRAIAMISSQVKPSIVLVGDGPFRAPAEQLASEHGLDATFLGVRSPDEVQDVLAASRILAAPSKQASNGDTEGLPTVVLEGAAAGIPIIATRHAGTPEAVIHGTTGLLSPEGDLDSLSWNILQLLESPQMRLDMGAAGRRHIVDQFDIRKQTHELELLYDSAVQRHRNSKLTRNAGRLWVD